MKVLEQRQDENLQLNSSIEDLFGLLENGYGISFNHPNASAPFLAQSKKSFFLFKLNADQYKLNFSAFCNTDTWDRDAYDGILRIVSMDFNAKDPKDRALILEQMIED